MKASVNDLQANLPSYDGATCELEGQFFYRLSSDGLEQSSCYLAPSHDSNFKILLPLSLGEHVVEADTTFGMLVGGEYAYFDVSAKVTGTIRATTDGASVDEITDFQLQKDGALQTFDFTGRN